MRGTARGAGCVLCLAVAFAVSGSSLAADIGQIKVARGEVSIERSGRVLPASVGTRLEAADIVRTGADGSVGITMSDESLLSAGPGSVLSLDRYALDAATNRGHFDASLRKGSLAVISGRIAKQSPDAMIVRTPTTILGVRGTQFVVSTGD